MAKKPAESESDETGSQGTGSQDLAGSEDTGSQPLESGSEAASGESSGSASGDATGEVSESGSASESSEETEEQPKKKGATGRSKRVTGKTSAVKSTSARATVSAPRGSGHELVPVICSECYEELVFDSGVPSPVLTCPICEHQAARPDDAQLAVIAEKRKQESTNFKLGLILCVVSVVAFGVWIWLLRNPHTNANENGPAFYGPMAVSLLAYLGCLGFTLGKYEGARHDVYF
jgi:cobalamin biosynthesis Mg chelatase CobN